MFSLFRLGAQKVVDPDGQRFDVNGQLGYEVEQLSGTGKVFRWIIRDTETNYIWYWESHSDFVSLRHPDPTHIRITPIGNNCFVEAVRLR